MTGGDARFGGRTGVTAPNGRNVFPRGDLRAYMNEAVAWILLLFTFVAAAIGVLYVLFVGF